MATQSGQRAILAKQSTVVTTRTRTEYKITAEQIRAAFGLHPNAQISVHVPGGGDWSNTALDLDEYEIEVIETTEIEEVK